jgi:hypothetical protein
MDYADRGDTLKSFESKVLSAKAVVAKMVNARGLEPRNTTNVIRVQIPFTAHFGRCSWPEVQIGR